MFIIVKSTEYGAEPPYMANSLEAAKECIKQHFINEAIELFGTDDFCDENCYNSAEDEVELIDEYDEFKERGLVNKLIKYFCDTYDCQVAEEEWYIPYSDYSFVKMEIFNSETLTIFVN